MATTMYLIRGLTYFVRFQVHPRMRTLLKVKRVQDCQNMGRIKKILNKEENRLFVPSRVPGSKSEKFLDNTTRAHDFNEKILNNSKKRRDQISFVSINRGLAVLSPTSTGSQKKNSSTKKDNSRE
jgi:hypothetical protein